MKIIRWLPAGVWMIVIYYLSSRTGSELNSILPFFQEWFPFMKGFNGGHFAAYFILACTIYLGLGHKNANLKGRVAVVFLCLVYGITDEFHQKFVEGRMPDMMDLRNDTIGAMLAMLLISIPAIHRIYMKIWSGKKY